MIPELQNQDEINIYCEYEQEDESEFYSDYLDSDSSADYKSHYKEEEAEKKSTMDISLIEFNDAIQRFK